jgi:signal transduction histidine kinase
VSHELRTPLTAIVGFAELLQAHWNEFSEARRLERIDQIVMAANRQQRLVEDLLLVSRLEAASLAMQYAAIAVASLLGQAVAELQASYPGQQVISEGPADLLVWADAARAAQVLTNLLDNAAKYSPEGSAIVVAWGFEGTKAVVRVRDLGPGIPQSGREQLFTRFGRVAGSRIRAGHVGTGLGLYISRGLAEAMGGNLDLEHSGAQGSTFRLTLPVATAEHALGMR